jgi:hypothetical protein
MKVIDSLLNSIEMYIIEIKKKKMILNKEILQIISKIFFNTGLKGSEAGSEKEKNKFKNYFNENNRLNVLFKLFKCLTSQILSPKQETITDQISITICLLLKNEIPLCYDCVLKYVKTLKSPQNSYTDYANDSWKQMIKADECVWNGCPFNEMIVGEDFEIDNGMLGLDRDAYLSVVEFLDSHTLRKV